VKISVVTVCFNSASTIERTLGSFFAQTHSDKELVVVDGGSTDGTLDTLARVRDPAFRYVSEPDRGIYDAMNKGLARFSGDAVGFLNSDDAFHDARVLADVAVGLESAEMVFGDIDFVADHETCRIVRRWRATPYRRGAFRAGWMAAHPSFYVRRAVAETVGRFDLRHRISADYDWMLRAFETHGFSSARLQRTFVDMKIGGASTRSPLAYIRGNLEALSARRRWLDAGLIDYALVAKPLGKIAQFAPGIAPALASAED
jgi:glycosyltransferase involved in cell wall biosynthesis